MYLTKRGNSAIMMDASQVKATLARFGAVSLHIIPENMIPNYVPGEPEFPLLKIHS